MKKEEILKRAQHDYDEMELMILIKALCFSTIVIPAISIIFILIRVLNSEYIVSDLVSITLSQLTISEIYQAIKMRKKLLFILGIITLIFTIIFTIEFIREVKI